MLAAMAAPVQGPLRRWKRFFGAFECIDAAIEASDPALSRHEFRSARGDIVELLCDAADDDQAEQLCLVLDDVMAESLETLRLIPATPMELATTDLAESVDALRKHDSERVRVLASGIMRGWKILETSTKKPSDQEGLSYEEKMVVAKRKINEGYREADEAKRKRKIQVVKAPEMLKQRERSRAKCSGSFMVNKTFSRLTS